MVAYTGLPVTLKTTGVAALVNTCKAAELKAPALTYCWVNQDEPYPPLPIVDGEIPVMLCVVDKAPRYILAAPPVPQVKTYDEFVNVMVNDMTHGPVGAGSTPDHGTRPG